MTRNVCCLNSTYFNQWHLPQEGMAATTLKKKKELIVDIGKHSRISGQKLRTCTKKVAMAMEKREAMWETLSR